MLLDEGPSLDSGSVHDTNTFIQGYKQEESIRTLLNEEKVNNISHK